MSGPPSGTYSIQPVLIGWIGVDGILPLVRIVPDPGKNVFTIRILEDGKYAIQAPRFPGFLCPDDGHIAPKCVEPYGWIISRVDDGRGYTIETSGLMPHQAWTLEDPNSGSPVILEYDQGSPEREWFFTPYVGS